METPAVLLRRAAQNRARPRAVQTAQASPIASETSRFRPPLPSGHASYSALMRSHDRMHTRHIRGQA